MSEQASSNPIEALSQSPIEGVRVVGALSPAVISLLPDYGEQDVFHSAADLPETLLPIKDLLVSTASGVGIELGDLSVAVDKIKFDEEDDDPFDARKLASTFGGDSQGISHMDVGERLILLACDSNPTVFYPKDSEGRPIIDEPWQPQPGEVVEFDGTVWHGPPLEAEGSGVRTLLTVRLDV